MADTQTLNGLRAIAILLVIGRHGATHQPNFEWPRVAGNFLLNGWAGVDLFFSLSGFLIGIHILKSLDCQHRPNISFILKFYSKRILRVFPLYIIAITLSASHAIPYFCHLSQDIGYDIYVHIIFSQDYLGERLLIPLWSLATEIKFYALIPLILICLHKRDFRHSSLILCATILLVTISQQITANQLRPQNYISFFWSIRAPFHFAALGLLIGTITALIFRKNHEKPPKNANLKLTTVSIFILIIVCSFNWSNSDNTHWALNVCIMQILSILFSMLIYLSIYTTGAVQKLLKCHLLKHLSNISYALYIAHMLIIPAANTLAMQPKAYNGAAFWLYYVVFSYALSLLLHFLVEKPFLKIKNKIIL